MKLVKVIVFRMLEVAALGGPPKPKVMGRAKLLYFLQQNVAATPIRQMYLLQKEKTVRKARAGTKLFDGRCSYKYDVRC